MAVDLRPAKVFISYSRRDEGWRQRFQDAMGSGFYKKKFELWYDKRIVPNKGWEGTIRGALAEAKIALLLVDNDFLNSDFIANDELPIILHYREIKRIKILWV